MKEKQLTTPLTEADVRKLKVGDILLLSGTVFTARDKAHKRIIDYLRRKEKLPFDFGGGVIYHCGPLAKRAGKGWKVVSAGPTTSARMNDTAPEVIGKLGLKAVVGKGGMSEAVSRTLQKEGCVYLAYTGGAGVLAADKIEGVAGVFWLDLSAPEAVWMLKVSSFGPLVVAMDAHGGSLYNR